MIYKEIWKLRAIDSRDARWLAEDLVSSVTGVRQFNNPLKILR